MAKSKKTGASQAGQSKSAASETAVIDHPESNGGAGEPATPDGAAPTPNPQLDPEVAKRLAAVRSQVRESFGKIVMALMMTPRYHVRLCRNGSEHPLL